jgi:glycosyltransferase involved in cell wall biosynthesis
MAPSAATISVVLSTYQRPAACERALRSALGQSQPPLEVLVCDDGSTDETQARMRAWEERDERVRYLRAAVNSGTPAVTRNLGIEHARGELIAFLDDDDEWLPEKLAVQMSAGVAVVNATNAVRSSGGLYFPSAPARWSPAALDVLRANPIITSSALVRRSWLLLEGGFPAHPRWRGLEDYAMWLALAGRDASFLVIGDPLVRYDDSASQRLSRERARIQLAVARLAWSYALRRPVTRTEATIALRRSAQAGYVLGLDARGWLRSARARC